MLQNNCLTIGGSHPTSEAGIQADINCGEFWMVHTSSVITTITAQNKHKFISKKDISKKMLHEQLISSIEVLPSPFVKIGMITNFTHYKIIESFKSSFSYILYDPILTTTTGKQVFDKKKEMLAFISSTCNFITPNFNEFQLLCNMPLDSEKYIIKALQIFSQKYNCQIYLKGGHSTNASTDYFINKEKQIYRLSLPIINDIKASHGTGCKIAMSIISNLANKEKQLDAVINAKAYVYECINNPLKIHQEWLMGKAKSIAILKKKVIITQLV